MTMLGAMLLMVLLAPTSALADTTVVVRGDTAASENEPGGWLFNRDMSTSTPYEFTTDKSSIGEGSLYVKPIGADNPKDKFIAEHFLLSPVGDLEEISYQFLVGQNSVHPERLAAADAHHFYLNVYTNFPESDATNFYDCRFDYAPQTAEDGWTSMTVTPGLDPTAVVKRQTDNYASPRDCPETLDAMPDNAVVRAIAINIGDSSTADEGVNGYLDNVVVTQSGDSIVYDFEASPADKDACKKGGYAQYSFKNQGQCVSYVASHGRSS